MISPTSIIVSTTVLCTLSIISVLLRFWVRTKVLPAGIKTDDWLAAAAGLLAMAVSANFIIGTVLGFDGQDYPDEIPPARYVAGNKFIYSQLIIEKTLYALIKLSALFFFRRIFSSSGRFKILNNALIALTIVWAITFTFLIAFECGLHPEQNWTVGDVRKSCLPSASINLAYVITDTVLDTLVIMMPYPCIKGLHLSTKEKTGLVGIFLLGALSTVSAWIRLGLIVELISTDYDGAGNKHGSATLIDFWVMVEGTVGVVAICLPPLAPLLKKKTYAIKASTFARGQASYNSAAVAVPSRPSLSYGKRTGGSSSDGLFVQLESL